MIPDFPEAKNVLQKAYNAFLRRQVKAHAPLMSLINKKMLHEGNKLGVLHSDGRHEMNGLQHVQSSFSVSRDEVMGLRPEEMLSRVAGAADDMAGQIERDLFQSIDKSTRESGNMIAGNPELGPESILVALEMVSVDFEDDDRAKPVHPSIVAAPAAVERLMALERTATPEEKEAYRLREEVIFDKKYEEHMQDVLSRKIID